MSSLAANLLTLSLACFQQAPGTDVSFIHAGSLIQSRQMPTLADPAYLSLLPNVVTLYDNGQPVGVGALIDQSGLYLAPKNLIGTEEEIEGRFSNGQSGHLRRLNTDELTGLALLKSDYVPPIAKPVSVIPVDLDPGTPVIVVLQSGSVRATIESADKIGISRRSGRLVPLTEIRLETPTSTLAGALVFTTHGGFVGAINATLMKPSVMNDANVFSNRGLGGGGAIGGGAMEGGGGFGGSARSPRLLGNIGPGDLTVSYAAGADVLHRVVEGFLTPNHEVAYASLGVFCRNGAGGALITQVEPGSPADKIGLRPGDMIVGLGIYLVRNQIDFAKVINKAKPGETTAIRYDQGGRIILRNVTLGRIVD